LSERKVPVCDSDRHSSRQIRKITRFCWCNLRQKSFWSWFDINQYNFQEDIRKNEFLLHFHFLVTLTFNLRLQICSTMQSLMPVIHRIWSFMAFRLRVNRKHRTDGRTDGRTDRRTGCNALCGLLGGPPKNQHWLKLITYKNYTSLKHSM